MDDTVKIESVNCDLCQSSNRLVLFKNVYDNALNLPGRFNIVQCTHCGLIYLNPRPDWASLAIYYPADYWPYQKDNLLITLARQTLWAGERRLIKKVVPKNGSVLEIGCAGGDFLSSLKDYGLKLYGLEMDPKSAALTSRLDHLKVWQGRFENFVFPDNQKFDFIVMKYVLEHLLSPKQAFAKLRSILSIGGYVTLSLPNYDSWERLVFGRYWHNFDVPRHFYIFNETTIRRYAQESGFKVLEINYSFVPNDWIGSIARFLREKGLPKLAGFFSVKNILLVFIFLPLSFTGFIFAKSSRFTIVLKARDF